MTGMYRSASLSAWTPPTVFRHHDVLFRRCFVSTDVKKRSTFGKLCLPRCCREEAHKRPVSELWMDTFSLRPDSWCTWSYRVNWLKAEGFGTFRWLQTTTFPNVLQPHWAEIWSALCSVEQTNIYQIWNMRTSPEMLRVQLKWEEKQNELKPRSFLTPTHVDQCSANFTRSVLEKLLCCNSDMEWFKRDSV